MLLQLLGNISRKLIMRDVITQYWYAWDFCGDLIRLFPGIDYFRLLLLTLYLKGNTQVEPDCVTQLFGTLCTGTLVSANLNPDPDPITANKVITKLLIFMSSVILGSVKEGMFLLIHHHRFYQSEFVVSWITKFPRSFQNMQSVSPAHESHDHLRRQRTFGLTSQ